MALKIPIHTDTVSVSASFDGFVTLETALLFLKKKNEFVNATRGNVDCNAT